MASHCSDCHQAEGSSGAQGLLPSSCDCWRNLFATSCGTDAGLFLQGQQEKDCCFKSLTSSGALLSRAAPPGVISL